MPETHVYYI